MSILKPFERRRVITSIDKVSKTEQTHKNSVNINSIMARYKKSGLLPQVTSDGRYGDFTDAADYQTCLERVMGANDKFMALPASIRKMFDNSPMKLLEFLSNEANREKAIEIGLVERPAPVVEPVVPATEA